MKEFRVEKGHYILKLDEVLKEKHVSINKLMQRAETDYYAIQKVMKGETSRYDIYVLARICDCLKCKLSDIVEYVPRDESIKENEDIEKVS